MKRNAPSLERLARLARTRPQLLAGPLAHYMEQERLTDQQIAQLLDCDTEAIFRLALCERPRQATSFFREDVQRIADYIHADMLQLALLIRAIEARETIRQTPVITRPTLLAARDHEDDDPLPAENEDHPINEE